MSELMVFSKEELKMVDLNEWNAFTKAIRESVLNESIICQQKIQGRISLRKKLPSFGKFPQEQIMNSKTLLLTLVVNDNNRWYANILYRLKCFLYPPVFHFELSQSTQPCLEDENQMQEALEKLRLSR